MFSFHTELYASYAHVHFSTAFYEPNINTWLSSFLDNIGQLDILQTIYI